MPVELTVTDDERKEYRRLYDLARSIERLQPWGWIKPGDVFGIQPMDVEEPYFVCFFEGFGVGAHIVRYLYGWYALRDFLANASSNVKPINSWLLEIPMFELCYLPKQMLFPVEQLLSQLMGEDGTASVPAFRSVSVGYQPWIPDPDERKWIDILLYQTYGMALRLENDPGWRRRIPRDYALVLRQNECGRWADSLVPVIPLPPLKLNFELTADQRTRLRRLKRLPIAVQMDVRVMSAMPSLESLGKPQVELVDFRRPSTGYLLVAADKNGNDIYHAGPLSAVKGIEHLWSDISTAFISLFEMMGGYPSVIEAGGGRMIGLLQAYSMELPFKLVHRDRLELMEEVFRKLDSYLSRKVLESEVGGK